jgi:hypothetical protein
MFPRQPARSQPARSQACHDALAVGGVVYRVTVTRGAYPEWDAIFERIGESMNIALSMFESPELGSNDDARKIRANYMAIRAYLVALGKHEVAK